MKKIKPVDLTPLSGKALTDITVKFLANFVRLKNLNQIYKTHAQKAAQQFVLDLLQELHLDYEVNPAELKNIPGKGAFVAVSNFPLGGIEGLLLYKLFSQVRPDIKLIVTRNFHNIQPLSEISLPLPESRSSIYTISYLRKIYQHVHNGHPVIVFPAIKPARYKPTANLVIDRKWNTDVIRLIKAVNVPVLPVFVNNQNSFLFHVLGIIHPLFQAMILDKEWRKKKDQVIPVRIGKLISHETLTKFDAQTATRYLRSRVFALGINLEVNKFRFFPVRKKPKDEKEQEPIIEPIDPKLIKEQINQAKKEFLQFSVNEMDVLVAPTYAIPDVLTEIGRLRELTFRQVDEGTGKSLDLDEFDIYYHHLIIWDRKNSKIAGAYRIGKGDEILEKYGVSGFYTSTLFKYKKEFYPILERSLELGRSFIVPEYQRKPLSLFLLWKGILYFLLKNINYQYLIGPVSLSVKFSEVSKDLIVRFFRKYYSDERWARYVKPRMPFKSRIKGIDRDIILNEIGNDLNKLDNIIKEIEGGMRIPVLYKKYISLGAKVLTFNVDPDFNYCVDGLMLLDLYNLPLDTVRALAKELDQEQLLDRFVSA